MNNVRMDGQEVVRIPPKRLRLVGLFVGSAFAVFLGLSGLVSFIPAIARQQFFLSTIVLIVGVICLVITISYLALVALWALVRLLFNLPALILTPLGLVNHSIVYHVVVPWEEIEEFTNLVHRTTQGPRRSRQSREGVSGIMVVGKDVHRIFAMQQPVTKMLLRLFVALRPASNISTATTAGTQEEVWAQLERYVRKTLKNKQIRFRTMTH